MSMTAKDEYIELIAETGRSMGLGAVSSKIRGILMAEPREVSLDELAGRTGYSLSAVSTSARMLTNMGMVKRIRKPGSRKVFLYMEKDMMKMMQQNMKNVMGMMATFKARLPDIIKRCKSSGCTNEEVEIMQRHYRMMLVMESFVEKIPDMLKEAEKKAGLK
ncbi:MAG: winged helix-turn-helix transcriptional regulator [Candidatus Aenigmarchaeota archaeon]|nr:winged helix-turn-helix transcriptional regulator [Candidatus Aenigmarchaeota archaeon]